MTRAPFWAVITVLVCLYVSGCALAQNLQMRAQLTTDGAKIVLLERQKQPVIRLVKPGVRDYEQLYSHFRKCGKTMARIQALATRERYSR